MLLGEWKTKPAARIMILSGRPRTPPTNFDDGGHVFQNGASKPYPRPQYCKRPVWSASPRLDFRILLGESANRIAARIRILSGRSRTPPTNFDDGGHVFRIAHPNRTHARNIANAPFGPHRRDWIFGSSSANRQTGSLRGSGFYRGVRERPLPISTMAAMFFRMAHPNRTHARNIANAPFGPHDCDWIFGSSSANRQPGPLRGSGFYRGVHERPLPIATMAAMFFRMAHPNRTHARNIATAPFGPHDCDWIFGSSSANRQPGPLRGSGFYRGVHERPLP